LDPDQERIDVLLRHVAQTRERNARIPGELSELVAMGVKYSQIEDATGIPQSTAHAWVRRYRAGGK